MRVLFVYPNLGGQVAFPYGVAVLSAVLRQRGHRTALLNLNERLGFGLDLERIRGEVESFRPQLIGFSVVSNQFEHALRIARFIRSWWRAPMICGGPHATFAPEEVLRSGAFEFVCVGEGEEALLELVERLERGEAADDIPNIWCLRDGQVVRNPVRPFVDLERLPPPDYDLGDFAQVVRARDGWVGVMASRGCPYRCSYCFNRGLVELYRRDLRLPLGRLGYLRRRPVEAVLSELEGILRRCPGQVRVFIFDDDIFTLDRAWLREFCRRYPQRIGVPFVINAHVHRFDREMAGWLREAGCRMVKFGVESGSERIRREVLRRPMTDEQILRAFGVAHEAGLETSAFVMLGLPLEEEEDLRATPRLLGRLGPTRFRWSLFFPYPGTEAARIAREAGLIDEDRWRSLPNFTDASCLDFGPRRNLQLRKMRALFPWYVNAEADIPDAPLFRALVEAVERLDEEAWRRLEPRAAALEAAISGCLEGRPHYAIRYNPFMAVRR